MLPVLGRLGARPGVPSQHASVYLIPGEIPAAQVHQLRQLLPALTRGEGVLDTSFTRYEPTRGPLPRRARSDLNPLDRKEYLLAVNRRITVGTA